MAILFRIKQIDVDHYEDSAETVFTYHVLQDNDGAQSWEVYSHTVDDADLASVDHINVLETASGGNVSDTLKQTVNTL